MANIEQHFQGWSLMILPIVGENILQHSFIYFSAT